MSTRCRQNYFAPCNYQTRVKNSNQRQSNGTINGHQSKITSFVVWSVGHPTSINLLFLGLLELDRPIRLSSIFLSVSVSIVNRKFFVYIFPGDAWGVGCGRIWIICVRSDTVFVGFLSIGIRPGSHRNSTARDEIRPDPTDRNPTKTMSGPIGFLWKMSVSDEIRRGFDWKRSDLLIGLDLLGVRKKTNDVMIN
jgi:hypothetical protein